MDSNNEAKTVSHNDTNNGGNNNTNAATNYSNGTIPLTLRQLLPLAFSVPDATNKSVEAHAQLVRESTKGIAPMLDALMDGDTEQDDFEDLLAGLRDYDAKKEEDNSNTPPPPLQ